MRLVVIESPYAGKASRWWGPLAPVVRWWRTRRNVAYARSAMRYCLVKGWAPIASHLLYMQPGILRDTVPAEREQGINAGFVWAREGEARLFFVDFGYTPGMVHGKAHAAAIGQPIEEHRLPGWYVLRFFVQAIYASFFIGAALALYAAYLLAFGV